MMCGPSSVTCRASWFRVWTKSAILRNPSKLPLPASTRRKTVSDMDLSQIGKLADLAQTSAALMLLRRLARDLRITLRSPVAGGQEQVGKIVKSALGADFQELPCKDVTLGLPFVDGEGGDLRLPARAGRPTATRKPDGRRGSPPRARAARGAPSPDPRRALRLPARAGRPGKGQASDARPFSPRARVGRPGEKSGVSDTLDSPPRARGPPWTKETMWKST